MKFVLAFGFFFKHCLYRLFTFFIFVLYIYIYSRFFLDIPHCDMIFNCHEKPIKAKIASHNQKTIRCQPIKLEIKFYIGNQVPIHMNNLRTDLIPATEFIIPLTKQQNFPTKHNDIHIYFSLF